MGLVLIVIIDLVNLVMLSAKHFNDLMTLMIIVDKQVNLSKSLNFVYNSSII